MTKSKKKSLDSNEGALLTSMVIMAAFVVYLCWAAFSVGGLLLIYTLPYLLILGCSYLRLIGKVKSETLRRFIVLLNILGTGSVIFFVWAGLNFIQNFTW